MSVFYVHEPSLFQPVLSDDIFFTVSADTYNASTTFNFRFVYELWVENELVFQGKCTPNEYGLGIMDLQQVLESYTSSLPISYWNTTPIYTHQTFPFSRPANDETLVYYVKTGYEYSDDEFGPVTGFTGWGNSIGAPAVISNENKIFRSTMGVNGRANQQSFDIGPFVMSGGPIGQYPTTSGLFLTNAPRIMDVDTEEYFTLGFTNYYLTSNGPSQVLSEPYYVEYKFYDGDGVLLDTKQYDNITFNGGGPRGDCNYVYPAMYIIDPWTGTNYNTLYVGAGPKNLEAILPTGCTQYTVQLYGIFEGETSPIPATPTPTPTPSSTPVLSPTPTPTGTPRCGACEEYTIEYTGLSEFGLATFVNCDTGASQSFRPLPTVIYVICSCSIPTGLDLDVQSLGPCTVTPTPTPTPQCTCEEYYIENESPYLDNVTWIDCNGVSQNQSLPAFQSLYICACQGSVGTIYSRVDDLGACSLVTPTPTATPTSTPVISPSPTKTPTPTPAGYAYYYLVEDCDNPGSTLCFASNTFYVPSKVVKGFSTAGCWEILDFCSAPEDDYIISAYNSCPSCPR